MNTFLIFKVFTCSLVLLLSLSKPPQDSRNSQWKYKQTPNWSQNWNDNIVLLFARIGSTNNGIFTRTKIEIFTQTSQQQGWWQQLNARQRNTIRKLWPKKKELNFFLMPELICRNIMFRISVYAVGETTIWLSAITLKTSPCGVISKVIKDLSVSSSSPFGFEVEWHSSWFYK